MLAASLICVAYRGSGSFCCIFSANRHSDPHFLANICYMLPSYASLANRRFILHKQVSSYTFLDVGSPRLRGSANVPRAWLRDQRVHNLSFAAFIMRMEYNCTNAKREDNKKKHGGHRMANQEHLDLLKQGVETWNQWRKEHPDIVPDLSGANLYDADLSIANLGGANLSKAMLFKADLRGADLHKADLRGANLGAAKLRAADLSQADLRGADLRGADLREANLYAANLRAADLFDAYVLGANLSQADLSEANLSMSDLSEAVISGTILSGAHMSEREKEQLRGTGIIGLDEVNVTSADIPSSLSLDEVNMTPVDSALSLRIRILEEPLTAHNLATATSALTQLHTQCWLIATNRFADLIEYTQAHNPSFDEEANLTIAQMTHHSPAEIKFNVSLEGVANALKTAIDAVTGMWERKRELELKNTALEEEIWRKKQEAGTTLTNERIAQQVALVELYDKQIELRRKQLDLLDYAAEKAPKIVEALRPDADATVKAMAANALIKSLSQLGEAKELELLPYPPNSGPPPQNSEEKTVTPENE